MKSLFFEKNKPLNYNKKKNQCGWPVENVKAILQWEKKSQFLVFWNILLDILYSISLSFSEKKKKEYRIFYTKTFLFLCVFERACMINNGILG